ncbi:oxidoreductase [Aureococcus anophagefferens]|nr:oxidoreductase [Aureococcus anophagefferens]
MTSCLRLLLCVAALLGADGFHAPARRAAARPASRRRPGVAAPARPPRRTGPLAFYQGGVLGVGTPEVLVVAAVGYFLLGPEDLFKLSKEIGKVVAQVRTYVTDSAAEWQSTFNDELDFKEVKEIQAAAQELQEAFNFRSSRYQNDYSNFNSGADETYDPLFICQISQAAHDGQASLRPRALRLHGRRRARRRGLFGKHAGGTTWALAGRNAKKLEALRASDAALARVPLVVADVGDAASMDAMAKSCDLVVSAAGPYALLGEAVVRACVDRGTHCLDVTGEVHWVAEMATKFAGAATASCLASFGGYDCVPDEATVFAGCRAAALRDLVYWGLPSFSSTLDCFTVPNFMGAIQIPVVHRSGHDNGYVLDAFRFKDRMARSYGGSRAPTVVVATTGHGAAGASATATLRVRGDAGIVATAALCGEVALATVEAAAAGGLKAGFTTPVGALGDELLARLEQSETMSLVVAKEA